MKQPVNMEERVDARGNLRFAGREIVQKLTEFHGLGAGFVVERVENYPRRSLAFLAPKFIARRLPVLQNALSGWTFTVFYVSDARYRRLSSMSSCILSWKIALASLCSVVNRF